MCSLFIPLNKITLNDRSSVGGKAAALGELLSLGLPVPDGVCLSQKLLSEITVEVPDHVKREFGDFIAKRKCSWALRSSALVEDSEESSFAGQFETALNLQSAEEISQALLRCLKSAKGKRVGEYAGQQREETIALLLQEYVEADFSGVLFTKNPKPGETGIILECLKGSCEQLVSGNITPYQLAFPNGDMSGILGLEHLPETDFKNELLGILPKLLEGAKKLEAHFGKPQDIEWCVSRKHLYFLQSRPITTGGEKELIEEILRGEKTRLKQIAGKEKHVWSFYNLSEQIEYPTPMTYDLLRRWLSHDGGYGLAFREAEFPYSNKLLSNEGAKNPLELVCGRLYTHLNSEALSYDSADYDYNAMKANPALAVYPKPKLKSGSWLNLPGIFLRAGKREKKMRRLQKDFAKEFEEKLLPEFLRDSEPLRTAGLSPEELVKLFFAREKKFQLGMGKWTALLNLIASYTLEKAKALLEKYPPQKPAIHRLNKLLRGLPNNKTLELQAAIDQLNSGQQGREDFLKTFGHLSPNQPMELAEARWSEGAALPTYRTEISLQTLRQSREEELQKLREDIEDLPNFLRGNILREMEHLALYYPYRETGKYYLLMEWSQLRCILLAIGERFDVGDLIFHLRVEELKNLSNVPPDRNILLRRKKLRAIAKKIPLANVLHIDDIEGLGRLPPPPQGSEVFYGLAASSGIAEGLAVLPKHPDEAFEAGSILVVKTLTPDWTGALRRAKAAVIETGGMLSHGAIVAREFGLPCVVNAQNVCASISNGQKIRVDANAGAVTILKKDD